MKLHAIVFALFASGCAATVEAPPMEARAVSKAPVAPNPHAHTKLLSDALDKVSLRAEQRVEVDELTAEVEARHQNRAVNGRALLMAIADRVEDGTLQRAALQPKVDGLGEEIAAVRAADRATLSRLHDLLDEQQRTELATALATLTSAKRQVHGAPDSRTSLYVHWKKLAGELHLSDEQTAKIDTAIQSGFEEAQRARETEPPGDAGTAVVIIAVAEKIVPLLTPDQRKGTADRLRALAIH